MEELYDHNKEALLEMKEINRKIGLFLTKCLKEHLLECGTVVPVRILKESILDFVHYSFYCAFMKLISLSPANSLLENLYECLSLDEIERFFEFI